MSIAGFADNYFEGRFGTCLVKVNAATGIWEFMTWVGQNETVIATQAPGSTYTYQIWLVCGYTASSTTVTLTGTCKIAVFGAKK